MRKFKGENIMAKSSKRGILRNFGLATAGLTLSAAQAFAQNPVNEDWKEIDGPPNPEDGYELVDSQYIRGEEIVTYTPVNAMTKTTFMFVPEYDALLKSQVSDEDTRTVEQKLIDEYQESLKPGEVKTSADFDEYYINKYGEWHNARREQWKAEFLNRPEIAKEIEALKAKYGGLLNISVISCKHYDAAGKENAQAAVEMFNGKQGGREIPNGALAEYNKFVPDRRTKSRGGKFNPGWQYDGKGGNVWGINAICAGSAGFAGGYFEIAGVDNPQSRQHSGEFGSEINAYGDGYLDSATSLRAGIGPSGKQNTGYKMFTKQYYDKKQDIIFTLFFGQQKKELQGYSWRIKVENSDVIKSKKTHDQYTAKTYLEELYLGKPTGKKLYLGTHQYIGQDLQQKTIILR